MVTERLNAYIHLFQNSYINEKSAEQQKVPKRRKGPRESALNWARGRTRTGRRPGGLTAGRGQRPGASEVGGRRPASGALRARLHRDGRAAGGWRCLAEPRWAGTRGRRPALSRQGGRRTAWWRFGRLAPGGRSAVDRWRRNGGVALAARRLLLPCGGSQQGEVS
ncbi:hypothetical protein BDA96_10G199400 [Sorghum bicolor]|uniref:Uncharacterized protein n=1 Tax=Sorghum bicolor TaxID=4558 RepID=A0A921Q5G4_SORBI|nr:hypothetical protein BDA96_10G199400 [Sorghum bicolor]